MEGRDEGAIQKEEGKCVDSEVWKDVVASNKKQRTRVRGVRGRQELGF